jgi:hypothetical protein
MRKVLILLLFALTFYKVSGQSASSDVATEVSNNSVLLNGEVWVSGTYNVEFEYKASEVNPPVGPYLSIDADQSPVSSSMKVTANLKDLAPNTNYFFRVKVGSSTYSGWKQFQTDNAGYFSILENTLEDDIEIFEVGDFNSDGLQDIVASIKYTGELYIYLQQNGVLVKQSANLLSSLSITDDLKFKVIDLDNDQDDDIVVTGTYNTGGSYTSFSKILTNQYSGSSVSFNITNLPSVLYNGGIAIYDISGNGKDDIIITGSPSIGGTLYNTNIYINNSTTNTPSFSLATTSPTNLDGLIESSISVADCNNDGEAEIIIVGEDINGLPKTYFYMNSGNYTFTVPSISINNLYDAYVEFVDINNDNKPDLFISGIDNSSNYYTRLYNNTSITSTLSFTLNSNFEPVFGVNASWGDFDKDGDLDLLYSGINGLSRYVVPGNPYNRDMIKLYRNDNCGASFTEIDLYFSKSLTRGNIEWIDFNNDNNLDFICSGFSQNSSNAAVYKNTLQDYIALYPEPYNCLTSGSPIDNLKLYLPFDEVNFTSDCKDLSNKRECDYINNPSNSYQSSSFGIDNNSIYQSAAMYNYPIKYAEVEHANNQDLDFDNTESFTICAWVNISKSGSTNRMIISKVDPINNTGYILGLHGYFNSPYNRGEYLALWTGPNATSSTPTFISSSPIVSIPGAQNYFEWHFVVVTIDRSNNLVKFYSDNSLISSQTISSNHTTSTSSDIRVSANEDLDAPTPTIYPFKGEIDEVMIYNKVLSINEISYLYNNGTPENLKHIKNYLRTQDKLGRCENGDDIALKVMSNSNRSSYQWQSSIDNVSWSNINNTTNEYQLDPGAEDDVYLRCLFNENLCSGGSLARVTKSLNFESSEIMASLPVSDIFLCDESSIQIDASYQTSCGNTSFKWYWFNGDWNEISGEDGSSIILSSTTLRNHLGEDIVFEVSNGCGTYKASATIHDFRVSYTYLDESNQGLCDGEISFSIIDGKAPYSITIYNQSTQNTVTYNNLDENDFPFEVNGLCPGTYTVTVNSNNNCDREIDISIGAGDAIESNCWETAVSGTGEGDDVARQIITDNNGNVIIAGNYESNPIDFGNSNTLTNSGSRDIFLVKYDNNGSLLWKTKISGTGDENTNDICKDWLGNIYLIGNFNSATVNFYDANNLNSIAHTRDNYWNTYSTAQKYDFFVVKYNSSGIIQWIHQYGGEDDDIGRSVIYSGEYLYSATNFKSPDLFDMEVSPINSIAVNNNTSHEIAIIKVQDVFNFSFTGNTYYTVANNDEIKAHSIRLKNGYVYLAGVYKGNNVNFGQTSGGSNVILQNYYPSDYNTYLLKLDKDLISNQVVWAQQSFTNVNGTGDEFVQEFDLDADYNIYMVGMFWGGPIQFMGAHTQTQAINNSGGKDMFMVKYDEDGEVLWLKTASSSGDDVLTSICYKNNKLYTSGYFNGASLNFSNSSLINSGQTKDMVLFEHDLDGNTNYFMQPHPFSGDNEDHATSIIADNSDNVFTAGFYRTSDLEFGSSHLYSSSNQKNVFMAKFTNSSLSVTHKKDVSSINGSDGEIDILLSGCVQPCQVSWYKDNVPFSPLPSEFELRNLSPGEYKVVTTNGNGCYMEKTIFINQTIFREDGVSEEINQTTEISIYPNPTSTIFNISYQFDEESTASVLIYNAMGQLVYTNDLDTQKDFMQIRKEEIGAAGVYTCVISVNGKKQKTQKLIITE